MSKFGYYVRYTSSSIREDMLEWLNDQENIKLTKENKEWTLEIKGKTFTGEDLTHVIIEAESMVG